MREMASGDCFTFRDDLHEALMERARSLRPLLEGMAAEHERRGELAPEVVEAISQAGFFSMSAPRRWGGLCVSSRTLVEVTAELAKACPSSAWVVSIITNNSWTASTFADAVQSRIFGEGMPIICGPQNGLGKVEPDGRGFLASGRWGYGSGSHHASWAIMPCLIGDDRCMIAVPMSDLRIEPSWNVAGMKGTGSDTIVADKVRLDADQIHRIPLPGQLSPSAFEREPSDYWMPFPLLRAKALGVVLGVAEGLVEAIVSGAARPIIYSAFGQRSDSAVWRAGLGEAAAMISAVRSLLADHTRRIDEAARDRRLLDQSERGALRGEGAVATKLLNEAVDRLMNLGGSSTYALEDPAQRFWRDFSIASRHIVFNIGLSFEIYGGLRLGMDPEIVLPDFV